jgi:L-malate glycosyltransferase
MAGRIFQVVDVLEWGDGVGEMVRAFAPTLAMLGAERAIVARWAHPDMRASTVALDAVRFRHDDALIVHFWGPTELEPFLIQFPGPIALFFHNVTPPSFFSPGSSSYEETTRALGQLDRLAKRADLWLAESQYNIDTLSARSAAARPTHVIPPCLDEMLLAPVDPTTLARLTARDEVRILFVGRLAPNKSQDRVMAVFDHYHRHVNPRSRLHLVGAVTGNPVFYQALKALRSMLASGDAIDLVGKVSDSALAAYYAAADLFLCLSEHEGFCIPPLIAAARGVPVVARSAGALPETLAQAALLVDRYEPGWLAELMGAVIDNAAIRVRLAAAARAYVSRFRSEVVAEAWRPALSALRAHAA